MASEARHRFGLGQLVLIRVQFPRAEWWKSGLSKAVSRFACHRTPKNQWTQSERWIELKRLTQTTLFAILLGTFLWDAHRAQAQRPGSQNRGPVVTSTRVAVADRGFFGPLYVTIGGQERKIADEAIEAWIIQRGRKVVYSGRDGAGGFENEGQSLRIYDASTGKTRKILSEYYGVDKVTEARTRNGKTALLVEMADGGLGASYLAVVDPARGEVFFRRWVKIISLRGDTIVIGHYREGDWEKFHENENARVTPHKTERQNLNTLLLRRVIRNKPDR